MQFYDAAGKAFLPTGGTLCNIARIDATGLDASLRGLPVVAMCDIDNPLYGPSGAAHVFGPQKGANAAMVAKLDAGLRHLAGCIERDVGTPVAALPGAGAAGGMGAGMVAFLGAELQMGIEVVLSAVHFDELLRGKVVVGVARRAAKQGVPVAAIVGDVADDAEAVYAEGVSGIFSINRLAVPFAEAKPRAKEDLARTVANLMRYSKRMGLAGTPNALATAPTHNTPASNARAKGEQK